MPNDVEVMIVSYNSATVVEACLSAIAATIPGCAVAIREHGDEPDSFEALATRTTGYPGPIRVEHDASNPGFGAGCNALAASSTARWFLFLNPDAEILAWPWNDHDRPRERSIYGPEMVDSGHPGDHSGVTYRVTDELARSWLRRRGPKPNGSGFVSGAALLIDADSFRRLGGFDERYFLFYEDIDLCLRANANGVRTEIEPGWRVRHSGAHSTHTRFGESLMWSYDSGCRFHSSRGSSVLGYRSYVVIDSLARAAVHAIRRDPDRSAAYARLARRAASDLTRGKPVQIRS